MMGYDARFWFGQAAMAILIISCMAIADRQSRAENRPPWFYFVSLWALAIAAAAVFGDGFTNGRLLNLPPSLYILGAAVALEHFFVYISYWVTTHKPLRPTLTTWGNVVVLLVVMLLMVGGVLLKLYSKVEYNGQEISKLRASSSKVVPAVDTALIAELRSSNDTLKAENKRQRITIAGLEGQVTKLTGQIDGLTSLLINLNRKINLLTANVERSRQSIVTPQMATPKPTTGNVPRAPVYTPHTEPTRKGRPYRPGKNQTSYEEADSTGGGGYYVRRGEWEPD